MLCADLILNADTIYLRVRSGFFVRDVVLSAFSDFLPRKNRRKSIFNVSKMIKQETTRKDKYRKTAVRCRSTNGMTLAKKQ